jgi:hypothetical protein
VSWPSVFSAASTCSLAAFTSFPDIDERQKPIQPSELELCRFERRVSIGYIALERGPLIGVADDLFLHLKPRWTS